jgi:hypothetical protein
MENVQMKKSNLQEVLRQFWKINKAHRKFLGEKTLLDYCTLQITDVGFSIQFSKALPAEILAEVDELFKTYTAE